ncbi:MAG: hypothetical protein ACYS0C_01650 [Planctomycetota bacterium]|jgi:hypothetical protein
MFNIFEHPWGLITVAIISLPVLLMVRRIFPEKRHWWQLALPALLALAAFGFDFLVETDLEKIKAVISTAAKAVEQENPDAIDMLISDNYRDSYHETKARLMFTCRSRLLEPLIEKNIARVVEIDISPPAATTIFTVRIVFDKRSLVYQNFKSQVLIKAKLNLQKQLDNRWLINRVEILEMDRQPTNWRDIKQARW